MSLYRIQIRPLTAFGSPLLGDMLFGQMCCSIAEQHGGDRLSDLLRGYKERKPFCVISDAFPSGYLPLPSLPSFYWKLPGDMQSQEMDGQIGKSGQESEYVAIRKELKKRVWIPLSELCGNSNPKEWRNLAKTDKDLFNSLSLDEAPSRSSSCDDNDRKFMECSRQQSGGSQNPRKGQKLVRSVSTYDMAVHNTIRRTMDTTGEDQFAPYAMTNLWYRKEQILDLYVVLDQSTHGFGLSELYDALDHVGKSGFGRDATAGLGKFEIVATKKVFTEGKPLGVGDSFGELVKPSTTRLTLASSVLLDQPGIISNRTYYRTRTHFGRHGSWRAIQGTPFKHPLILACQGAVVMFDQKQSDLVVGNGVGNVSRQHPEAVHQGFSPVVAIPDIDLDMK